VYIESVEEGTDGMLNSSEEESTDAVVISDDD